MTRPGIEPRPPGPLANTLTARPFVLYNMMNSKRINDQNTWLYKYNSLNFISQNGLKLSLNSYFNPYLCTGAAEYADCTSAESKDPSFGPSVGHGWWSQMPEDGILVAEQSMTQVLSGRMTCK